MMVDPGPTIIMMCGLQGSGKTTTCGKLAAYLKGRGKSVMVVAADLQRPAAVEQLQVIAEQVASRQTPSGCQGVIRASAYSNSGIGVLKKGVCECARNNAPLLSQTSTASGRTHFSVETGIFFGPAPNFCNH